MKNPAFFWFEFKYLKPDYCCMKTEKISDLNKMVKDVQRKQYPLILAQAVIALAKTQGVSISLDKLNFSTDLDCLRRQEMYLGFLSGEGTEISSAKFVVYTKGIIRSYAGDGNPREFYLLLGDFVNQIKQVEK